LPSIIACKRNTFTTRIKKYYTLKPKEGVYTSVAKFFTNTVADAMKMAFSVSASVFMQHLGLHSLAKETFEMVFLVCEFFILPETKQVYKQ
jgi:hypothetical protein